MKSVPECTGVISEPSRGKYCLTYGMAHMHACGTGSADEVRCSAPCFLGLGGRPCALHPRKISWHTWLNAGHPMVMQGLPGQSCPRVSSLSQPGT